MSSKWNSQLPVARHPQGCTWKHEKTNNVAVWDTRIDENLLLLNKKPSAVCGGNAEPANPGLQVAVRTSWGPIKL